ncbi:MAG TPA: hypothetical protein PLG21_16935 [Anaerolineae bacterium]|nr:hypothetical protein [Anaerolineae bacterium]
MSVADILMGPVKVYYAPSGATLPDENSVAAGAAWGGTWVLCGETNAPLSCNYTFEEVEAKIQSRLAAVKRRRKSEALTIETVLAELTALSLELADAGTKTITTGGPAQVAKEEIEAGGKADLTVRAWGFEGIHVTDTGTEYPARFFIFRGTGRLNGALEFSTEKEGTGVPLQVKALADTSKLTGKDLFKFQRVTGPKVP